MVHCVRVCVCVRECASECYGVLAGVFVLFYEEPRDCFAYFSTCAFEFQMQISMGLFACAF